MGRLEKVLGLMVFSASVMLTTMCAKVEETVEMPPAADSQGEVPDVPVKVRDTLYVTGVEYPEGYDWYQDSEYGEVRCFIFLEKEGKKILRVPVGYEYETASDADMHRCFDGHLYTDYSSDTETVVKRDGHEIFRYDGREMLVSFYVKDESVYTLGVARSGETGLTLRKNGKVEAFYETGVLLSGFREDAGRLTFAFFQGSDYSPSCFEYYVYDEGKIRAFAEGQDVRNVLDAIVHNGEICYVAECNDISGCKYYCYCGDNVFNLDTGIYKYMEYARLMPSSSSVTVGGVCSDSAVNAGMRRRQSPAGASRSSNRQYFVWDCYGFKYSFESGNIPEHSFISDGNIYDIVSTDNVFSEMEICIDGERKYSYGRNRWVVSQAPAALIREHLYFVFSGSSWPHRPFMSVDEKVKDGGFNGYYSSVSAW